MDDESTMPATAQLADLEIYHSSEDFDMFMDDIDMDAFMYLDDNLDSKPSAKKEEANSVISKKPPPKGIKVEDGTRPMSHDRN